jgi:immunoglobulin-binding protein 1
MIQQSINAIKEIQDEQEMLDFAKLRISTNDTEKDRESKDNVRLDEKPKLTQYSGPMLSSTGKPLRPFVITSEHNKREEIRKGVFKPGHNLPTMSIEEYIDREMERGNFLSGGGY